MPSYTYTRWIRMKGRCYNPNDTAYVPNFTVCDEWRHDYTQFLSDMGEAPKGATIQLLPGHSVYSKGTCQWVVKATRHEELITIGDKSMKLSDWAYHSGLLYQTVYTRYKRGVRGPDLIKGGTKYKGTDTSVTD